MVFVILLCQQVEAHDHDAQHHQHDTGRAVEGLGVRLIGKDRRNTGPEQGKEDAEGKHGPVRGPADGKVGDSTRQGRERHDEDAGAHGAQAQIWNYVSGGNQEWNLVRVDADAKQTFARPEEARDPEPTPSQRKHQNDLVRKLNNAGKGRAARKG